ncbi:MAG: imidazole glycerol phosphate synthase subunit HisH [Pseudomonadales bacterium]|nr:imidazole glycerol phosphate synthase subunit HisH [Pseudomonadales bacterium]
MTIIVDYDAGNLKSVQRACDYVGLSATISNDAASLAHADRIIFPGVGAAGSAMKSLRANGLDKALLHAFASGTPILGICLGLQVSLDWSEEHDTKTLSLLPGEVVRFDFSDRSVKIPHMGWNEVKVVRPHPVLSSIRQGDEFYFVHAYYPRPSIPEQVFAEASYQHAFCAAAGSKNYLGVQFHPEKSGRVGLKLLSDFASWDGSHAE